MMPTISVLILTYNRQEMVCDAVASVLAQTFHDFELLVMDDGSNDATLETLAAIKDPRLRLIPLEHSGHIAAMRHGGLVRARGDYVAFLDSDDTWGPNFLASLLAPLESNPDLVFAFSNCRITSSDGTKRLYDLAEDRAQDCFLGMVTGKLVIYPSSVLFRLNKKLNWDQTMRVGDHDFLTRLALTGSGYQVATCLTNVQRHQGNLSDSNGICDLTEFLSTVCRQLGLGQLAPIVAHPVIARFSYQLGIYHLELGQRREARRAFLRSFYYRFNIKALIRACQTLLPWSVG